MFNYLILKTLVIISIIGYSIYRSIQKINKFKNAIYNISACSETAKTNYYLMVEIKHGQSIDARKLTKKQLLFIPNTIIPILKDTYKDYESAENSLQELKNKYLCS
jgi:hypothetical protein